MALTKQQIENEAEKILNRALDAELWSSEKINGKLVSTDVRTANAYRLPITKATVGVTPGGGLTFNAGASWHSFDSIESVSRAAEFKRAKGKPIIDIGLDANIACITFSDMSTLQIGFYVASARFVERTSLEMLNGTSLRDIFVDIHRSLIDGPVLELVFSNDFDVKVRLGVEGFKEGMAIDQFSVLFTEGK